MMKDTPQGQTNYCPMCEDAAKRIEELERHNAMLADALKYAETFYGSEDFDFKKLRLAINATSAQSSAWLNKKHVEFMKSLPVVLTCTVRKLQENESIPSFDLRWSNNRPISGSFVVIPSDKE